MLSTLKNVCRIIARLQKINLYEIITSLTHMKKANTEKLSQWTSRIALTLALIPIFTIGSKYGILGAGLVGGLTAGCIAGALTFILSKYSKNKKLKTIYISSAVVLGILLIAISFGIVYFTDKALTNNTPGASELPNELNIE